MTFATIIASVLKLTFPRLPAWVPTLILGIFTKGLSAVKDVEAANGEEGGESKLSGAEKFEIVSDHLETFLRTKTSQIPGWSQINRTRRAKLIGGLIELAVFIVDISDGSLDMSSTAPTDMQLGILKRRGFKGFRRLRFRKDVEDVTDTPEE